ncbi:MAG TPA: CarD family transcriptional regulator [Firmicutes bacterium]|jgi:CarD family transcriptional regulator|nr:CarD family transcriptional regulator [Bacillota bacterium]
MFKIGDKIVYPMHGAGIIDAIEVQEVLGEYRRYYVMQMPIGDMKVMIPMANVESLGIREVISAEEADDVFKVLQAECTEMPQNWNHRFRNNREKIRTGDIFEVAEVVRNLACHERTKGLSTGERKMLENARQILISELVLAKNCSEQDIEREIDRVLA